MQTKEEIKEQRRKYRLEHEEQRRKYRSEHKEEIKERNRKYRLKNKEKIKEEKRKYRLKNKEWIEKRSRKYRLKHKKEKKEYMRKYQLENKEECRIRGKRSHAVRKAAGNLSIEKIQKVYEENIKFYGTLTCIYCLRKIKFGDDTLEHKQPVSRGGTNKYENLAIACSRDNFSKQNKNESEYRDYLAKQKSLYHDSATTMRKSTLVP